MNKKICSAARLMALFALSSCWSSDTVTTPITGPQYAYITNGNANTVSNCLINSTTGLLSDCGSSTSLLFNDPNSIALNKASALAYITNFASSTVTLCTIESVAGSLTDCADTTTFANPRFITLNTAMTYAYVAGGGGVSLFSADGSGALILEQNYALGDANGIALDPAGTFAYVVLSSDTVLFCAVDGLTGVLSPCTPTGSNFDGAQRITFNSNGTFAYVTNSGSADITVCAVDSNSGVLSSCTSTAVGVFGGFANMAINSSNTKAYVPDTFSPNLVSVCSISAIDGTLSGCIDSGGTNFDGPKGVAL